MKLLCFFVHYKAEDPLRRCLASLAAAQRDDVELLVHVLDNSEYDPSGQQRMRALVAEQAALGVHLHIAARNGGYFAGLPQAQQLARDAGATAVIYSNPDVAFAPDFLARLRERCARGAGVLAPAIVVEGEGFDQNPKYRERLPLQRLRRLQRIYRRRLVFHTYMGLARVKELLLGRRARPVENAPARIYAPHGAVFVFADMGFFQALPAYPCFLFGEELFVAEEARRRDVPVDYEPALRVNDMRSQSVSRLPGEFHRTLMLESVEHILEQYYRGETR